MKHMTNSLKNIILLIKPYWKYGKTYIILSIIMSVVVAPVNALASVFFTQSVIDAVAHEVSFFEVIIIILRFLFVLLFTLLIQNTFDIFYKEKKSTEIQLNLNQDIYRQILSTDYKYFDDPEFYNNYTLTVNEYSNKSREAVELIINILKSLSTIISMGSVIIVLGPWLVVITVIEMIITVFIETQKNNVNIDKRMKSLAFDRKLGYVHRVFYQREYAADAELLNTIKELDFDNIFDKSRGDLRIELTKEFEQNGLMLSNGEIQKIGIARILNNNFGLLILDEPSSSLDPIAEYKLTNILYSQANKTTTILIAHRLSMVRGADCIYVLKDGEICESGTHDELMKKRGMYYEMFIKQSENYHIYPQET